MRELKSPLSLYMLTMGEGFVAQFLFLSFQAFVSEAFAFLPHQRYGSIFVLRAFTAFIESGIPSCSIYGQMKAVRPRVVPRFTHTLALSR